MNLLVNRMVFIKSYIVTRRSESESESEKGRKGERDIKTEGKKIIECICSAVPL